MEVIGPQRIHHSPFAPLSQPPTRQMLLHQSPTASAGPTTANSNSTTARSQKSKRVGSGRETAYPPRLERAMEDKRQAGTRPRPRRGSSEAAAKDTSGANSTTNAPTTFTAAPSEQRRETRPSTAGNRRQQQARQNPKRWSKNTSGSYGNGSGTNSPRSSGSNGGPGSRTNRRRKSNAERQLSSGDNDHYPNHQQRQQPKQQKTKLQPHQQTQPTQQQQPRQDTQHPPRQTDINREVVTDLKAPFKNEGRSGRRKQSAKRRGPRAMSSVDSGKGEDLSSSCESSVFDPQIPSTCLESTEQRSRCASCSSLDEFHDALSHPASDDDGVNSSAFVTPFSTRSHSPTCLLEDRLTEREDSILSNESSIDKFRLSLKRLSDDQQVGLQESPDSHMMDADSHMTPENTQAGTESPRLMELNVTTSATDIPTSNVVEEIEDTDSTEAAIDADVSTGEGRLQVSDSGNSSSPASPAKSSHHPISVTPALSPTLLSLSVPARVPPSSSSGSEASPRSSMCSHSTWPHSPSTPSQSPEPSTPSQVSPSPSPTSLTAATDIVPGSHNKETDQSGVSIDELVPQEDEWPDLHVTPTSEVRVQPEEPHPPQDDVNEADNWPLDSQCPIPGNEGGRSDSYPVNTSGEFGGHVLEPHPQNAAAAYPHMVPPPQYGLRWFGHPLPPAAGHYGYYSAPFIPHGYYPPGPHMWPRMPPPPHMLPHMPYYHSVPNSAQHYIVPTETAQNDANEECTHVDTEEAPPTLVSKTEAQSSERQVESEEKREEGNGEMEVINGGEDGIDIDLVSDEEDYNEMTPSPVPTHHPLQDTWVMWYDKITGTTRNHPSNYRSSLKHLHTISCVEEFWRLYNHIHQPSHLDRNSNYHFFKEGIEPLWEDPANIQGGKWVLTIKEDESILDKTWEELLIAMIGGLIHNSNAINGAVMSRRKKGDRVALWTRKKSSKVNLDICADLLKVLVIACDVAREDVSEFVRQLAEGRDGLSLVYMYHADALKSGTSYQNSSHIHLRDNCESLVAEVLKKLT